MVDELKIEMNQVGWWMAIDRPVGDLALAER